MFEKRTFLLAYAVALVACGDNQEPEQADALWQRIQELEYRSWQRAPGYETRLPSQAPHGDAVDIYINATMVNALQSESLTAWPEQSLIVKDGFDEDELDLIAAMEKRDGQWFWAEYDDSGSAKYSGKPELCIDCHQSGDDFVRAFGLPGKR